MNRPLLTTFLSCALAAVGMAACTGSGTPDGSTNDVPAVDIVTMDTVVDDSPPSDTPAPDVACPSGQMQCASGATTACVDVMSDTMNCGSCGTACMPGQVCTSGSCQCSGTRVACSGTCVDTQTDPANCGACGTGCPVGQSCTAGACACPAPLDTCGAQCVRLQTDPMNCGTCGHTCSATESCSAGMCNSLCGVGTTSCGGSCINPLTDNNNCGACDNVCGPARSCMTGVCVPPNNTRATAMMVTLTAGETTIMGNTGGATHDGPSVGCACTSGPDVWYQFTLTREEVVYFDTAGSSYDTSIIITNSMGAAVPAQASNGSPGAGLCNDDSGCPVDAAGFSASTQSRTWGVLAAGTYYVVIGGCTSGAFNLHIQHLVRDSQLAGYIAPGVGGVTGTLPASNVTSGTCGSGGSSPTGEQMRIFTTCSTAPQLFSLCMSDGGTYERHQLVTDFDPVLYLRSGTTGAELACNDDGMSMGALDCRGTGGDMNQYGSRLNDISATRGIHAVYVDSRTGGDATIANMDYTLRYAVRNTAP